MEMTAEEAYQARLRRSQAGSHPLVVEAAQIEDANKSDNKIKKMMEAMGWKGKGLGKQEQGIINPLVAKKTDATSGFIEQSSVTNMQVISMEDIKPAPLRSSKVLVLENLVDPDQVDEFLRDEVKQECEQYGPVVNCIVH